MAARTISIDDDIHFNVLVEGPDTGPVILLSHALMANLRIWDETVPALHSFGYRTIRYDAVGHGKTTCPTSLTEPTFDDFTHHIHKLAKACAGDDRQPKLAAILDALWVVYWQCEYVDAVMCCDAPGMATLGGAARMWDERVQTYARGKAGEYELCIATVNRWLPGSEPHDDYVKQISLLMCHSCAFEGYKASVHAMCNFDYESELGKVKQKVLVVRGKCDSNVGPPEILESVAKEVGENGCGLVTIEGAGHIPPMHRPKQFNKVMQDFLGRAVES